MWQLLAQWMTAADDDAARAAETSFRGKAEETRELWCTALSFWRALSHDLFKGRARIGLLLRYGLREWSAGRVRTSANGAARLGQGAHGTS
jgi:hypothetical protein